MVVSIAVEYIIHLNSVLIRSGFTVRENGGLGRDWSQRLKAGWDLEPGMKLCVVGRGRVG